MTLLEFWGLVLVLMFLFCWVLLFRYLRQIDANLKDISAALAPQKQPTTPAAQQFKPSGRY